MARKDDLKNSVTSVGETGALSVALEKSASSSKTGFAQFLVAIILISSFIIALLTNPSCRNEQSAKVPAGGTVSATTDVSQAVAVPESTKILAARPDQDKSVVQVRKQAVSVKAAPVAVPAVKVVAHADSSAGGVAVGSTSAVTSSAAPGKSGFNVRFAFNSSSLSNKERQRIADLAKELISSKQKISLVGHTDSTGAKEYNIMLSEKRANAVARVLLSAGLSKEQVAVVSGKGPDAPVADNATAAGRAQNRRAEVLLS